MKSTGSQLRASARRSIVLAIIWNNKNMDSSESNIRHFLWLQLLFLSEMQSVQSVMIVKMAFYRKFIHSMHAYIKWFNLCITSEQTHFPAFWILILVCPHSVVATPKKQWQPPTKPFQNLSTYRNTYKPHQTYRKIPSYKPPNCYSPPKSPFMVRTLPLSIAKTCFHLEMLELS